MEAPSSAITAGLSVFVPEVGMGAVRLPLVAMPLNSTKPAVLTRNRNGRGAPIEMPEQDGVVAGSVRTVNPGVRAGEDEQPSQAGRSG